MNREDSLVGSSAVLNTDQDHIIFTGERIVINKQVKQTRNNILQEHLARYEFACDFIKEKKVLDAACGTGYGTRLLKDTGADHVTGIDISQESIDNAILAYKGANIDFIQGDVYHLPFQDAYFDVVVSFETIEHVPEGNKFLKEVTRVLKDEGLLIISTPNRTITNPGAYLEEPPPNSYHCYEYTLPEFIGELLKYFNISTIYGQTFFEDYQTFSTKVIRQARNLNINYVPEQNKTGSRYCLTPLGEIKNANPMYVIAVCQKK